MARKNKGYSGSYIQKRRILEPEQAKAIINSVSNEKERLLLKILYEVGCTVSELAGIKVEDIKTDSIRIVKNGRERNIIISHELRRELKDYLKKALKKKLYSEFLFSTRQSPKMDIRRVQQIVKKHLGSSSGKVRQARIVELAAKKTAEEIKKNTGLKRLEEKDFLGSEEIERIKAEIKEKKDSLAFGLLLETGCKISELVDIKVEDIGENSVSVGTPKREAGISRKLASEIKSFVDSEKISGFLFQSRQSGRISDRRIFQVLKLYGEKTGVKVNPRILRNTKIARMLESGQDRKKIQDELGIKRLEFSSYGLLGKNKNE